MIPGKTKTTDPALLPIILRYFARDLLSIPLPVSRFLPAEDFLAVSLKHHLLETLNLPQEEVAVLKNYRNYQLPPSIIKMAQAYLREFLTAEFKKLLHIDQPPG